MYLEEVQAGRQNDIPVREPREDTPEVLKEYPCYASTSTRGEGERGDRVHDERQPQNLQVRDYCPSYERDICSTDFTSTRTAKSTRSIIVVGIALTCIKFDPENDKKMLNFRIVYPEIRGAECEWRKAEVQISACNDKPVRK